MSLRLRLMLGFILLSLIGWGTAAIGSWWQTRHNINKLFDTQQMLFATRLATMNPEQLSQQPVTLPKSKKYSAIIAVIRMMMRWLLPSLPVTAGWCLTMATMAKTFSSSTGATVLPMAN